ncbi:MAG: hypothetical protein HW399_184 [Dehalococcoidia bacterium]|nr:hypothetical protein [Dehalococcoidia bacterium]
MALDFYQDAISLSGLTGSKLKSEIIGEYYSFWWNITSGGEGHANQWPTAIIELDAATGEIYVKDTREVILGSSGHAMDLKFNGDNKNNIKIILVEKNADCYGHLKNVVSRRWDRAKVSEAEGPIQHNHSNVYLWNVDLDGALSKIALINLGNSLFFFDPLRGIDYKTLDKVAKARIRNYYQTGTEFLVFVFTSDWFLGRDDFNALPTGLNEANWTEGEKNTVTEADNLFGTKDWRVGILNDKPISERESDFIEMYKKSLHKWFRYVLPMPFNPKDRQIYHLILCSNFEVGVRATRGFFCTKTSNPDYKPDNNKAYALFKLKHPELFVELHGNQRPRQWKILWKAITGHEEGICDSQCKDFIEMESIESERDKLLEWLAHNKYLTGRASDNPWNLRIKQYMVNWDVIKQILGVEPPNPLQPLSIKPLSLKEINK